MTDDIAGGRAASHGAGGAEVRVAVAVAVGEQDAELVADQLFQLGATAVSELSDDTGGLSLVADLTVTGIDHLRAAGHDARVMEPERSWTEGWRDHARIWRCGGRVVLRPAWLASEPLGADDVEVVVEPGGAFGSGSHETTRLCAGLVERLVEPGSSLLDVGCGSGVLGVVAARLGATRVVGVDVEPEAVRVTRALAESNGVAGVVSASATPVADLDGDFDLVVANLLTPIIEELAQALGERVAADGALVLSGLLAGQTDRVLAHFPGWSLRAAVHEGAWVALELRRA